MKKVSSNMHFGVIIANHSDAKTSLATRRLCRQPYKIRLRVCLQTSTAAYKARHFHSTHLCLSQLLSVLSFAFCVHLLLHMYLPLLVHVTTVSKSNAQ